MNTRLASFSFVPYSGFNYIQDMTFTCTQVNLYVLTTSILVSDYAIYNL